MKPTDAAPPTPVAIWAAASAYQRTAALKAAVDLDLFTAIGEGKVTAAELAKARGIAERGARILSDYLTVAGFLEKHDGRYSLTRDSAVFLDRRSPASIASTLGFIASPELITAFVTNPAEAVRRGGTAAPEEGIVVAENPLWVTFARAMMPLAAMSAERLAERLKGDLKPGGRILDVAAGHGLFGIALAKRDPKAHVTALDWSNVLEVAKENAGKAGLGARFATIGGSAFTAPLGGPYDLILVINFLHHFDAPTNTAFLKRVHGALAPGGKVVVLEFVPNEDRVSPDMAAAFSFVMLISTPAGDAYTAKELDAMFRAAGFPPTRYEPLPPVEQGIVIAER
jgi:2-polyprenyl-3-methyl-5-hydroxy-6-metoxy-1,4-benzoquinol methylase